HGNVDLAVGNAIGSNIANMGLVLGIAALVAPLIVSRLSLTRELPISWLITLLVGILLFHAELSRVDGIIMLVILFAYLLFALFILTRRQDYRSEVLTEYNNERPSLGKPFWQVGLWWLISLLLLFVGAELLVYGAVSIARKLAISEAVIGLSVVAFGTSLPELAAAIASSIKRQHELVLGNIIGSNIFNLLAVLAIPALIHPRALSSSLVHRDFVIMFGFMLAPAILVWLRPKKKILGRLAGLVLVMGYVGYIYLIY
ncbi:MAG: calcium/sodium antiporter, partial [Gammaproteobacteria bacterium]|nr:calcium/sodium antiporter [Gammaproteobacteria bacterium]